MSIFTVEDVVPGSDLTIRMRRGPGHGLFGAVRVTYAVRVTEPGGRPLAVLRLGTPLGSLRRRGQPGAAT